MHWAQGTQPEPHELLQLHPAAPTALVIAVYEELTRRRGPGSSDMTPRHSLAMAYRGVMAARQAGDPTPANEPCHYASLCIDPGADSGIVDLAFHTLERDVPLPAHSMAGYRRREAHRVLSNSVLRARYDDGRLPATMRAPARLARLQPASTDHLPRKDIPVAVEKKKRGLFGLRRDRTPEVDPVDARIRDLRERLPLAPDEEIPESTEEHLAVALPIAEITFTAGPRSGMRVELESNVVPLGEGKSTATIWRHGERFLMRHNGKKVLVSGSAPVLAIVVLEDGDELAVGADHASFRLLPPTA
jgi:hypothetical protein